MRIWQKNWNKNTANGVNYIADKRGKYGRGREKHGKEGCPEKEEGYDFIYFCSMSVPAMITEVVVRIGYAIKRIKEGHSVKESIPFSLNREKHPKVSTLLFIGHSASIAVNAGKVIFTENPMAINYPQWLAFARYSYSQLKWGLLEKPELQDRYVLGKLNEELDVIFAEIDKSFDEFASGRYVIVMN